MTGITPVQSNAKSTVEPVILRTSSTRFFERELIAYVAPNSLRPVSTRRTDERLHAPSSPLSSVVETRSRVAVAGVLSVFVNATNDAGFTSLSGSSTAKISEVAPAGIVCGKQVPSGIL